MWARFVIKDHVNDGRKAIWMETFSRRFSRTLTTSWLVCTFIFHTPGVSSIALECQEVPENDFATISITYSRRTANKFITSWLLRVGQTRYEKRTVKLCFNKHSWHSSFNKFFYLLFAVRLFELLSPFYGNVSAFAAPPPTVDVAKSQKKAK